MIPFFIQTSRVRQIRKTSLHYLAFPAVFLFLAVLWYAVAANALIATSYRFSDISLERDGLSRELEGLHAIQIQESSPEMLERKAQEMGFSKIEKAFYLSVPGSVVARR